MLNYTRFRLFGLKLKENAVPRLFKCQPDRTVTVLKPRSGLGKITRKRKIAEIFESCIIHDRRTSKYSRACDVERQSKE